MKLKLIDFLTGFAVLRAQGAFCERIINIAREKGVFVQNILRDDSSITFTVSMRGARLLLGEPAPENVNLEVVRYGGIPGFFAAAKRRRALLFGPLAVLLLMLLSTQIVWNVNIVGTDPEMEEYLINELSEHGVKRGALKITIDQSSIKDAILIDNPHLVWLWVDLRGSTAVVKYTLRDMSPPLFDEDTPYNVYATKSGEITRIIATNGVAKVHPGQLVTEGQLLIEGSIQTGENEYKPLHASGEVFALVWEEKTAVIPKKTEIRTPTGEKIEHLAINFSNFDVKLFINSRILYPEYDMIEVNRCFQPLGISFNKKEYRRVKVTYTENDTEKLCEDALLAFHTELDEKGFVIKHTQFAVSEDGEAVYFTMQALCEEPIAAERRIEFGEDYYSTDS